MSDSIKSTGAVSCSGALQSSPSNEARGSGDLVADATRGRETKWGGVGGILTGDGARRRRRAEEGDEEGRSLDEWGGGVGMIPFSDRQRWSQRARLSTGCAGDEAGLREVQNKTILKLVSL